MHSRYARKAAEIRVLNTVLAPSVSISPSSTSASNPFQTSTPTTLNPNILTSTPQK